ncbi:MAG: DUF3089 domain-containing protein [Oceanococcaceae bacterium]
MNPINPSLVLGVFALLLVACDAGPDITASRDGADDFATYQSAIYDGATNWLCHPDKPASEDACRQDLRTISVAADGTATSLPFSPAAAPTVDCFYVYPTTSADVGNNADLNPGPQEIQTTTTQFARYSEVCRPFAPVYRQISLTRLAVAVGGGFIPVETGLLDIPDAAREQAYADVLDAFREYVANLSEGRGFVLVGHSQGAGLLRRLIAEEIETRPALHARMIAAHLAGTTVAVTVGADVGGDVRFTPACREADQHGCVVSYASYRAGDPQLDDPRFGTTSDPALQALCTNPAALAGGEAVLDLRVPFRLPPVFQTLLIPRGSGGPFQNRLSNLAVDEPYYSVPGQIRGECVVDANGTSYLEVRISPEPDGPRANDYPGEFLGGIGWGLHLADISLVQQNLVDLAARQAASWMAHGR